MRTKESQKRSLPIALTMGCPVGIGPEILCKLFSRNDMPAAGQSIVVGDKQVLQTAANLLHLPLRIVSWSPGQPIERETMPVLQAGEGLAHPLRWGQPDASTGKAMGQYIVEAVRLIDEGWCSAIVTCPISKKSLQQAGYPYPGHTEMLAALSRTTKVRMMMAGHRLRVVLVTIHEPLSKVSSLLTRQAIEDCIEMTGAALRRDFGLKDPKIAVAGLNPHGGEEGMFGDEEIRVIRPAVANKGQGGDVTGPWPPDTVFYQAAAGQYDAVVAMYHDQGLIPFKLLHFHDGVNVTLGLPFVRTSVDHGTAYDIAGRGVAEPSSLAAALAMAHTIVGNRASWEAV